MTPEIGKWYWFEFANQTIFGKCVAIGETKCVIESRRFRDRCEFVDIADIVSEATPPRRWWQFWRRG